MTWTPVLLLFLIPPVLIAGFIGLVLALNGLDPADYPNADSK